MFYGSPGTQNLMVAFILNLSLRKRHCQVKLGQITSNFHIQASLTKTYLSYPVVSQDSKYYSFLRATIRNTKNCISKSGIFTLVSNVFTFLQLHGKNKDIALKFVTCVVALQHALRFWITWKFWTWRTFIFEKCNFWILGVKIEKYQKIWHSYFIESSILRLLTFSDSVLRQTCTF